MNNIIYVLIEQDLKDNEIIVIGVSDSVENANLVFHNYYGDFEVINYNDIRDSGLVWEKTIKVEYKYPKRKTEFINYKVTLQWFELNKC